MSTDIKTLFDAGAHFGYPRARRHPSASQYLFATKDRTDIFDLEETGKKLSAAAAFVASVAQASKHVLFVAGKNEAVALVKDAAERVGAPYVAGRWIGGTLTNFKNIRKRIELLEKLTADRESGELDKYTKKERVLIDRDIDNLIARFGGIVNMADLPGALFIVDTRHENTAVLEAKQMGIPVVGLSSSDCDFSLIRYPIPANDTSVRSIKLVVNEMADAYAEGKRAPAPAAPAQAAQK
jgi:small subunit ribosomal protein S2